MPVAAKNLTAKSTILRPFFPNNLPFCCHCSIPPLLRHQNLKNITGGAVFTAGSSGDGRSRLWTAPIVHRRCFGVFWGAGTVVTTGSDGGDTDRSHGGGRRWQSGVFFLVFFLSFRLIVGLCLDGKGEGGKRAFLGVSVGGEGFPGSSGGGKNGRGWRCQRWQKCGRWQHQRRLNLPPVPSLR